MTLQRFRTAIAQLFLLQLALIWNAEIGPAGAADIYPSGELSELLSKSEGGPGYQFGAAVAVDGDTAVVGASNTGPPYAGGAPKVLVFERGSDGWQLTARLSESVPSPYQPLFGSAVAISGDTIVVTNTIASTGLGCAYIYQKPPEGWHDMTESATLTASDGAPNEHFGFSVDIQDETIVVGASWAANNNPNSRHGAVYVYVQPSNGWADMTQTAKLRANPEYYLNELGRRVALSGDVIAASGRGPNTEGRVYVFERPPTGWVDGTQTALLKASDPVSGDEIGQALDMSGDVIVAGAPSDAIGSGWGYGSVLVFHRPVNGWVNMTETAKLTLSDGAPNDGFGSEVRVFGDFIAIGTPGKDDPISGPDTGAVYVFQAPGSDWQNPAQIAKLTASDATIEDQLGYAIGLSDNVLLAGVSLAPDGNGFAQTGKLYIFDKPIDGWAPSTQDDVVTLDTSGDLSQGDQLGYSIASWDDTIAVGAWADDGAFMNQGAVFVFVRNDGAWTLAAKLTPSDPGQDLQFGAAVAVSPDTIVVARENGSTPVVYVFTRPVAGWTDMTETARLTPNSQAWHFGFSVGVASDTVIVGAPGYFSSSSPSGAVLVYQRPENGWTDMSETARLTASDPASDDQLGYALDIDEGVIVAGAPSADNGVSFSNRGAGYVFVKTGRQWVDTTQTGKLVASDAMTNARLGFDADIHNGSIVLGSPGFQGQGQNGKAYVYQPSGAWTDQTESAQLFQSPVATANFGKQVSLIGPLITIAGNSGVYGGSAYLFARGDASWKTMSQTMRLVRPTTPTDDAYAHEVAMADGCAFVTAYKRDGSTGGEQGAAYVFDLPIGDCNDNGILDLLDVATGTSLDVNFNGIPDECEDFNCPSDVMPPPDGDGVTNIDDLFEVISSWGPCGKTTCPADVNTDGQVNVDDLFAVIDAWGECP